MNAIYTFIRKVHSELLLLSILFLFFFETLNSFLTNVYALNFAIMGVGPYVALAVFLLSPPILLIFKGKMPTVGLYVTSGLLIISRILILAISNTIALGFITGVGVAAFAVFFPAYLVRRAEEHETPLYLTITQAFAIAIGLSIALKAIGSSLDFSMYGWGSIICGLLAAVVIVMVAGIQIQKENEEVTKEAEATEEAVEAEEKKTGFGKFLLLAMGLYGVLAMEWFVLAYPSVLSRWSDSSYVGVSVVTMIMVASFAIILTIIPQIFERLKIWMIITLNVLLIISVVLVAALPQQSLSVVQQVFTYFTAVLSPVALLDFMLLAKKVNKLKPSARQLGGSFGISSLLFLILTFAIVFSFNYEFVPGMGILRDRVYLIILLTALMAVVPTALVKGIKGLALKGFKELPKKLPQKNMITASVIIGLFIVGAGIGLGVNAGIKPSTPTSPTTITVMSFNLHQGEDVNGQFNLARVVETIRKVDPDIVGLQETEMARICFGNNDLVRYLAEKLDMYSYYGPKTVSGTYGVAILSKFPIESAETFFMPSEDSQRVILKSEIRVGAELITFYATHFGLASSERTAHAQFTANLTTGSARTFLVGDFNTQDTETQYSIFTSGFLDGWLAINPSGVNGTGYDGSTTSNRIDYIFFTSDFTIISFDVLTWAQESDHLPVVAVFNL